VGVEGQKTLLASRVLVLGAGGLGAPASFYLAAAGVGHLRIADDDVVDRSNLHRQILHTDASVGEPKVLSARTRLLALNPSLDVEAVQARVTSANIDALLEGVDVVLDGSDNFPLRYLLNDACLQHGIPLVYGAVERFTGQVSVFDAGRQRGTAPCYRCLFPEPPPPAFAPNCAEAGVLGVLPGLVGLLQATEVLKLLLGIGEPLIGRLLSFDALGMRFRETRLRPDTACPLCAPGRAFPGYIDYAAFCSGA
jgi:molybdopterin/thiamine biosynthesis adenylyltransferase